MLKDDIEWMLAIINSKKPQLEFNQRLFEIMEGNLLKYVLEALKSQLSANAYETASKRVVPINILRRIVNKLSKLYSSSPKRKTELDSDQELVDFYSLDGALDRDYGNHNLNFNSYKYSALEFFIEERQLKQRAIPATQFIVCSNDKVNPLKVTHYIKFMGKYEKQQNGKTILVDRYWAYTNEEFLSFDSQGEVISEDTDLVEGINTFGIIPMNYVSTSDNLLIPLQDDDLFQMAVNIPVKLSDLNFAQQFQSHGIIYVKNADNANLQVSPNTIWELNSRYPDKEVDVGTIQPQVSVTEVLDLCRFEISMWLESKDIRPTSAGQSQNDLSGLSLLIQNADIAENRKQQEQVFKQSESDFWKRLSTIHNTLVRSNLIDMRQMFSSDEVKVSVEYEMHKPYEPIIDKVNRLKIEVDSKFLSRYSAIKELHPDWSDTQIEEELEEIDEETTIEIPNEPQQDLSANDNQDMNTDEMDMEGQNDMEKNANS